MADGITVSEQRMSTAVSRTYQRSLVMLRRDLRIEDHEALAQACRVSQAVHLLFVFDRAILDELPDRADRRVEFIWESLKSLERLPSLSGSLVTAHAKASDAVPAIALALGVEAVFFNHDDEP